MNRRTHRWIGWMFGVLLALSVTPRGWVHDCARDHAHQEASSGQALKAVCAVCDLDFPVMEPGPELATTLTPPAFGSPFGTQPVRIPDLHRPFERGRGPPQVS